MNASKQKGYILVASLLVSLILSLVVLAAVNSGLMQSKIVTNDHIYLMLEKSAHSAIESAIHDAELHIDGQLLFQAAASTTPELFPTINRCVNAAGQLVECTENTIYGVLDERHGLITAKVKIEFVCETLIDDEMGETLVNDVAMKKVFLVEGTGRLKNTQNQVTLEQLVSVKGPASLVPRPCPA